MSKKLRTDAVDHLFDAILSLQNREECYTFFEDVCTVNELLSLSQRFEVAKMLRDQKTYLDIAEKTGASTATISRVNRSLNYGNDGYDMVFSRMQNTDKYFGKDGSYSLEDIYREVFGLEHQETQNLMKDLARKFNTSCQTFPDAAPEDAELLRNFSLICMLSYDVYVKKTIIERLIDTTTSDKSKTEKNKK